MYFDIVFDRIDKALVVITPCVYLDVELPIVLSLNISWLIFSVSIGLFTSDEDGFDGTDEFDGYV